MPAPASGKYIESQAKAPPPPKLTARLVALYALCDELSGALILLALVFSPWAFGATQPWSIAFVNAIGYTAGVLLLLKHGIRRHAHYWPLVRRPFERAGDRVLFLLIGLLLVYVLISALNARAQWDPVTARLIYSTPISWLPHSFDRDRTWGALWNYSALACYFWAARDWLLGDCSLPGSPPAVLQRHRVRLLLWCLALNGAALSLEGLLQRWEGSGRLLFLVRPTVNPGAESQFGPWAYRGSAAAYFNLLWPACLGAWAAMREARDRRSHATAMLACAAVMSVGAIASLSRGGAIIAALLWLTCGSGLLRRWWCKPAAGHSARTLLLVVGASALIAGWVAGQGRLASRLTEWQSGLRERQALYEQASQIARDYPLFGTGAGTFSTVYQFYRASPTSPWPAQLHNDWLETRITLGCAGSLLLVAIGIAWGARAMSRIYHASSPFPPLLLLGMAGLLVHARWDLPLQIYSVTLAATVLAAFAHSRPDLELETRQKPTPPP